jgi:23S rRNA (cytidine2498-2'-O)-methyltransferase
MSSIEYTGGAVYQAVPGFEFHLEKELSGAAEVRELLYISGEAPQQAFWTANIWEKPFLLRFSSINEAANALRGIQRNWAPVLNAHFRRGELIQSKLPHLSPKPRVFPWLLPQTPMGAWTLLDEHTILASAECTSPFPAGNPNLAEDKINPPSRAYLKLQEALTLARTWPQEGAHCLDAGACPGGWTWVLTQLGAQVEAIDRSPLDERLMANPLVNFTKHDAFTLPPEHFGPMDWVFSDVNLLPRTPV